MTKFFNIPGMAVYPDDATELHDRVLADSLRGPMRGPLCYFEKYFRNGGALTHPMLGEVSAFAEKIEAQWDRIKGMNLVAWYLRGIIVRMNQPIQPEPSVYEDIESSIIALR